MSDNFWNDPLKSIEEHTDVDCLEIKRYISNQCERVLMYFGICIVEAIQKGHYSPFAMERNAVENCRCQRSFDADPCKTARGCTMFRHLLVDQLSTEFQLRPRCGLLIGLALCVEVCHLRQDNVEAFSRNVDSLEVGRKELAFAAFKYLRDGSLGEQK